MHNITSLPKSVMAPALAVVLLLCASSGVRAEGEIVFQNWSGGVGNQPLLSLGQTLSVTKSLSKSSYSDNPDLDYSAWAHAGGTPWWTFRLAQAADVSIRLDPVVAGANFNPGLSVWASGSSVFDGGSAVGDEVANSGFFTPHSFNAVSPLGALGTYRMSSDGTTVYGNMKETLAYAVTGPSHDGSTTGWGETILHGVQDVSVDNLYEGGISGAVGANWLQLSFHALQPGYYVIFPGGTNQSLTAQNYLLSVNAVAAVPEPSAWASLLGGLLLISALAARRRV